MITRTIHELNIESFKHMRNMCVVSTELRDGLHYAIIEIINNGDYTCYESECGFTDKDQALGIGIQHIATMCSEYPYWQDANAVSMRCDN